MREMAESPVFREYMKGINEGNYDFYRCWRCGRVFSREEERSILAKMTKSMEGVAKDDNKIQFCKCGSLKYTPSWPVRKKEGWRGYYSDNEWLEPRIRRYVVKLWLARAVAPWCERHLTVVLPLVEWLVKPKEA